MVAAVVATLIAGLAMLLVAYASASSSSTAPKVAAGSTMIVQPGDTLWSIAQHVEPNRDPRQVVDQLRQLNHLTSVALSAGQTLKLG
jgi:LysM repeat protein